MFYMNLFNKLILFRIFLILVFVLIMLFNVLNKFLIVCIIFIIVLIIDVLDGKIVRKYNLVIDFGKFMDLLVDKLLVILVFICMIEDYFVSSWMVIIIVVREFIVSILRVIVVVDGKVIVVGNSGKFKMII